MIKAGIVGGSGYMEESIMPRLYREAPVNAIWEGSGNIQALDNRIRGLVDVHDGAVKDPVRLAFDVHDRGEAPRCRLRRRFR